MHANSRDTRPEIVVETQSSMQPADAPRDRALPQDVLHSTLAYARERDYAGYDYSDGTSSPIRSIVPGDNRWINLVLQETAKRSPVNVRPLLGIPKRRNFKGAALFASANIGAFELTTTDRYLADAEELLDWLVDRRGEPYGWGHNHDLQLLDRQIPRNTPDIVATTYGVRAIMELARHVDTDELSIIEERLPRFIRDELLVDMDDGDRLRYEPTAPAGTYVLNANALGGALLVELGDQFDDSSLHELGTSLLDYVASQQHPLGGWEYMDPPDASHLSIDNHHTGFILESFLRYRERTGSDRYDRVIEKGLRFYREVLFDPNGAPRWDETSRYPRDIHGAAQGIVTFSLSGDLPFASRILGWTLQSMYDDGRFYYRKGRFYTRQFTLMRWCQAWMAYALSCYCRERRRHDERAPATNRIE